MIQIIIQTGIALGIVIVAGVIATRKISSAFVDMSEYEDRRKRPE